MSFPRALSSGGRSLGLASLAMALFLGGVVQAGEPLEIEKIRRDAQKGDAAAQARLADCYYHGRGIPRDYKAAADWYLRAALQGVDTAQLGLGECYYNGFGVRPDRRQAARWYRVAAEQGLPEAQFAFGYCSEKGHGVAANPVEAYRWYVLAATKGATNATIFRDRLKSSLTPEQIAEGDKLSAAFVPTRYTPESLPEKERAPEGMFVARGSGSGFFVSEEGHLLTSFHVVENARRITVSTTQGSLPAELVKADALHDVALLKVACKSTALALAPSQGVKLGDSVFTIGFPNTRLQGVEPKLTDGRISSLAGIRDDARYFQISVPVQPGNSGGPLVNEFGNVVGIVSSQLGALASWRAAGALPQNVNYAVKSSYAQRLLESLPELAGKLRARQDAKERKFADVVSEVQGSVALVLVY